MIDSRLLLEVSGDDRGVLACAGITLESAFTEIGAPRAIILVYRLDPSRSVLEARPADVVKFSEGRHAIPFAESLKLATPQYYREFEGSGDGIRDEMEARYQEDLRSVFAKTGVLTPSVVPSPGGHVTYSVDGFWLFCTSVRPPFASQLEQLRKRFGAERGTTIADPSAFARELGAAFAAESRWPEVHLRFMDELAARLGPTAIGDRIVRVRHGAVCYSDDPVELIESFPIAHRAAVMPFFKRRKYSWQQEYRFSVSISGRATGKEWFLPLTPGLRRLAQAGENSSPDRSRLVRAWLRRS